MRRLRAIWEAKIRLGETPDSMNPNREGTGSEQGRHQGSDRRSAHLVRLRRVTGDVDALQAGVIAVGGVAEPVDVETGVADWSEHPSA